jgi:hypothetical protein
MSGELGMPAGSWSGGKSRKFNVMIAPEPTTAAADNLFVIPVGQVAVA